MNLLEMKLEHIKREHQEFITIFAFYYLMLIILNGHIWAFLCHHGDPENLLQVRDCSRNVGSH